MSVSGLTGPAVLWSITATSTAGPVRPVPDKYAFQVPDKKTKEQTENQDDIAIM